MPAQKSKFELDRYDVVAIANHYRRLPFKVWWRCIGIFLPLMLLFLSLWWDKTTGKTNQQAPKRAKEIRVLLTKLGPAFIKIGQALSTRPDIVPPAYMNELAQLQDQLPAFSNEQAFQFIREELGANPQDIYAEISPNPIAAASLGQVYMGKLHTGELVAIKVQRPDINEAIGLDMYILRGLSTFAMQHIKFIRSNLEGILDEFASRIFEEMDYTCEGANAEKFAKYYGQLNEIHVPKIYWKYTGRRVLTMEWIEGIKLTDVGKLKAQGLDGWHIIEVGIQCSLKQLLDYGFFHADPHPGNLLVMPDGRLAYLDFGMMSQVSSEQRYGLIEAIVHLVNRDFDALVKDYVRLGFLSVDVNAGDITPALARVFNEALGTGVADLELKDITDQLSQIMYDYPFEVPAYYALIIRSLVTLEGIALGVDPDFKILSVAYPYVANRLLSDSSPELQASLKDLLFRDGQFRWNRLENLLKNAKSNQDYDLKDTIAKVSDFLLSERGEYIRDRLTTELVQTIETETFNRLSALPAQISQILTNGNSKSDNAINGSNGKNGNSNGVDDLSGFEHIANVWAILAKDKNVQPLEYLPLASEILRKPETQALGLNIASQLAQRAIARLIRDFALKDQLGSLADLPIEVPQIESKPVLATGISRTLNGRTW